VSAELLKLRTTRTAAGFAAAALLLSALFVTVGALTSDLFSREDSLSTIDVSAAPLLALILAIVGVTGEYRHGTIASTFLAVPDRRRQVVTQAAAYAVAGVLLTLACWVVQLGLGLPLLSGQDAPGPPAGDVVATILREALASALLAALGAGFAALVRHQAAAIIMALIALLFVEPTITSLVDGSYGYGPLSAATALVDTGDDADVSAFTGGVVLACWAAALLAAGAAATQRRDVG
jgi:ABC-2 type transport system permease protein